MTETSYFDAIIFYFWLPQEAIDGIFSGMHKWWFMHGLGYKTCIFYGPTLTRYEIRTFGPIKIVTLPLSMLAWSSIQNFLLKEGLSTKPIISIVVEARIAPSPTDVISSNIPVQCLVADTHHMSNPITSALEYLIQVNPIHVSVSHSSHRKIFSDCLGIPIYPLVYSPRRHQDGNRKPTTHVRSDISYYGSVSDPFHPERTYVIETILRSRLGRSLLKVKPRMSPPEWESSIAKDLASFTCSLNGFPSVQSYIPLVHGTCLISDHLSPTSDLGRILKHGENCLLYKSPEEAIHILEHISSNPEEAILIGQMGRKALFQNQQSISQLLLSQLNILNTLFSPLIRGDERIERVTSDSSAITACFAYELIQELHRLSSELYVTLIGGSKVTRLIATYLEILPRISMKNINFATSWAHERLQSESGIVLISHSSLEQCSSSSAQNCLLLSIDRPSEDPLDILRSINTLDPNAFLKPNYKGVRFCQALPANMNISLVSSSELISDVWDFVPD